MAYVQYAAAVIGICVLLWPQMQAAVMAALDRLPAVPVPGPAPQPAPAISRITFQAAISHLAAVRERLVATDGLSAEAKGAVDVLTLALVAGCEK